MAQESATAFLAKVRDEKALQGKLRSLQPTDFVGLLKSATDLGFQTFTKDEFYVAADLVGGEWVRWAAQMKGEKVSSDELSEADLEQVAGGKGHGAKLTVCYQASLWLSSPC